MRHERDGGWICRDGGGKEKKGYKGEKNQDLRKGKTDAHGVYNQSSS